ncbi:MAG TPA: nucleoside-triphosphatase [Bacteroidia bacterium]|nr:nucleoside-triphosphatase [Bacteroidia bacterium]
MQIHLLSQAIQTGKTTSLMQYVQTHSNCSGILTPVIGNQRFFYSIASGESKLMEAESSEKNCLQIGRYNFSKTAFEWAIAQCENALKKPQELFIIDEIGPLELRNEGFYNLLTEVLANKYAIEKLVLVVRTSAVDLVLQHFNIDPSQVLLWKNTQP